MSQDWSIYRETIATADKIKRLRGEMLGLKQTQEEQEFLYFLSCAIGRLEIHLNNLRKRYMEDALEQLKKDPNAPLA